MVETIPADLKKILEAAKKAEASDVHLKVGVPPILRINGELYAIEKTVRLTPDDINRIAYSLMGDKRRERFIKKNQLDLAMGFPGIGRFRVNIFQQRGSISIVLRVIPFEVKSIEDLHLPKVIFNISQERRGLILVTGTTGSGKTTTLAAMIDAINSGRKCHIVTIEDPIEILHRDKRSIINQREVGFDTDSFSEALKASLRQDPDVILVGEMRDFETIDTALKASETGHLVLSTLHTTDATETIARIISFFPTHQQQQIRLQMSSVIKGIISQRLIPKADGKGRVPAVEILVSTARVREYIEDPSQTKNLRMAIAEGATTYGMQTFDQSLMLLFRNKLISMEEALNACTNKDDFKLKLQGIESTADAKEWGEFMKTPEGSADGKTGDDDDWTIERF